MKTRLLLVSQRESRQKILQQAVEDSGYQVAASVVVSEDFARTLANGLVDVIIFDVDEPDDDLLVRIKRLNQDYVVPIVMFSGLSGKDIIARAVDAGVVSYVVDGFSARRISPIVETALVRYKALHSLRMELQETKNRLEDRKHIDKAKGLLMQQKALTEDQAYKLLRKLAMDRNIKIGEAACNVIAMADFLQDAPK